LTIFILVKQLEGRGLARVTIGRLEDLNRGDIDRSGPGSMGHSEDRRQTTVGRTSNSLFECHLLNGGPEKKGSQGTNIFLSFGHILKRRKGGQKNSAVWKKKGLRGDTAVQAKYQFKHIIGSDQGKGESEPGTDSVRVTAEEPLIGMTLKKREGRRQILQ